MSDLAMKEVVDIGGREVIVRELTPASVRRLLMAAPLPAVDAGEEAFAAYRIDAWLFEECRLSDLAVFTNLSQTELEGLPPSQLRKLIAEAKRLNPDFFNALDRMAKARSNS